MREGSALLQCLATCGTCGRKLAIFYGGPAKCVPNYHCQGSAELVNGRGARHMSAGGQAIDAAVAEAFLAAPAPAALQACPTAARQLEDGYNAVLAQHRRQVEQARYNARRRAGRDLGPRRRPRPGVEAPTTTDKDRKQLLRTLLDEVNITLHRDDPDPHASLILRWKGGAISELTVPLRRRQPKIRTSEDTISLIRRLAVHYPDAQIAGIGRRESHLGPERGTCRHRARRQ